MRRPYIVNYWIHQLKLGLERAESFAVRHPRALMGIGVTLLSSFAVAAFGIAPLAPNADDLPRHMISEVVMPIDLDGQLAALAAHQFDLTRSELTRSSDTADTLLRRLGAFDPQAAAYLRKDELARRIFQGRPGKMIQAVADASGRVESLIARFPSDRPEQANTHFSRLSIKRGAQGFSAQLETVPLSTLVKLGSGTVRSSLFAATDEANIPDAIATQMADMLSGDIDFHRDLRKGDRFSVVYETLTADGEPINWSGSAGHVLATEFVNNGQSYSAVLFKDSSSGKESYYSFDGENKRRAFLASPMEFSRVTSGFAMRFHPILHKWKAHLGIDYGAPIGTPVRTIGDGVVQFAGTQNGFGNVVYIRHANNRMTVYGHLSRIFVKKGQHVEQGQHIGAVGMTGWATGPHLHFEFRVNGQQKDPRVIAKSSESIPLPVAARPQFNALVASVKTQLTVAQSMVGGVNDID